MKILYFLLFMVYCAVSNAQAPSQQFIPAPLSMYGNVLQYHYSQSQWYYKELVEQNFNQQDMTIASQESLNAMLSIRPKIDRTISILDIYKLENNKFRKN